MSSTDKKSQSGVASNRSVTRAVDILRTLSVSPVPMTATDIATKTGLPRPTAFRLLSTLENEGIVDRQETLYSLGWDLIRIARAADPATGLRSRVGRFLDQAADTLGETITLSIRNGYFGIAMILQSLPRTSGYSVQEVRGTQWPLHASATGKLLLAALSAEEVDGLVGSSPESLTESTITDPEKLHRELDEVRSHGWALNINESEEGIFSAAVPVTDAEGVLTAAIAVAAPVHRVETENDRQRIINVLRECATEVRHRMVALPLT